MPLLELRDVEVAPGATGVLRGVSLVVESGEVVTLLGRDGAAKSALLDAIAGSAPLRGELRLDDERVLRRTPERLARLGVVHLPAGGGAFAGLTVLDNLRLGAWVRRGASQRDLARVYERFPRLYERRGEQAGRLTALEQRQLSLARAQLARPRLLLLDEPLRGLAQAGVREVLSVLGELREGGAAVVLAEQNVQAALSFSDRALVLEGGRVTASGNAATLRRRARLAPDLGPDLGPDA